MDSLAAHGTETAPLIYLDNRVGSGDLAVYFSRWRLPHELCRLDYGDVAFIGNGPDGQEMPVGIEIKKVNDALACITDGRFAGHQLPGLVTDFARVWLVVEGNFTVDERSGLLVHRRGKRLEPVHLGTRQFMYRDLSNWLTTMEVKANIKVRRTVSRVETARFCADLHSWWTNKQWDEHRAHLAFDEPLPDHALLYRPNTARRVAKELSGVGWVKSAAVAKRFKTVRAMVDASEHEWMEVEGIGKTLAKRIVEDLNGGGR